MFDQKRFQNVHVI